MKAKLATRQASVLIMVLWALTLLTVFAIQIGLMTRDKISFLARAERQSVLRLAAKGGIAKALALIKNDQLRNKEKNLLQTKLAVYFNSAGLRNMEFGQAEVSVIRGENDESIGITDEESRLNVNTASRDSIRSLLISIGAAKEDEADKIAGAIYDWREFGQSEIEGFSSDNFYDNLADPYEPKKGNFETLDELRLVDGVTEQVYNRLIDYVTIFGNQDVNINTVSSPVLVAWGLTEDQAHMVETIRRGADGSEGTPDDNFFENSEMLANQIIQAMGLEKEEAASVRLVTSQIPFIATSNLFRVKSTARYVSRNENKSIACVFDSKNDRIIYWREQ